MNQWLFWARKYNSNVIDDETENSFLTFDAEGEHKFQYQFELVLLSYDLVTWIWKQITIMDIF